jgi:tetratricopeptide (TPR) repeat protein
MLHGRAVDLLEATLPDTDAVATAVSGAMATLTASAAADPLLAAAEESWASSKASSAQSVVVSALMEAAPASEAADAERMLRRAVRLLGAAPGTADAVASEAWAALGGCLVRKGQLQEAATCYEECLALAPSAAVVQEEGREAAGADGTPQLPWFVPLALRCLSIILRQKGSAAAAAAPPSAASASAPSSSAAGASSAASTADRHSKAGDAKDTKLRAKESSAACAPPGGVPPPAASAAGTAQASPSDAFIESVKRRLLLETASAAEAASESQTQQPRLGMASLLRPYVSSYLAAHRAGASAVATADQAEEEERQRRWFAHVSRRENASIEIAKQAVAVADRDPASWGCLGTAYLSEFLRSRRDVGSVDPFGPAGSVPPSWQASGDTQQARTAVDSDDNYLTPMNRAYARAVEADNALAGQDVVLSYPDLGVQASGSALGVLSARITRRIPDVHYNRAQALAFQEEYDEAVRECKLSGQLDPQLPWPKFIVGEADAVKRTVAALSTVASAARPPGSVAASAAEGTIRPARDLASTSAANASAAAALRKAVETLTGQLKADVSAFSVTVAPGADGSSKETATLAGRRLVSFRELQPGRNEGVFLPIKLIMPVPKNDRPPASVIALDAEGEPFPVAVYHLTEASLSRLSRTPPFPGASANVSPSFVILDPVLKVVPFIDSSPAALTAPTMNGNASAVAFRGIHVPSPWQLLQFMSPSTKASGSGSDKGSQPAASSGRGKAALADNSPAVLEQLRIGENKAALTMTSVLFPDAGAAGAKS